MNLFIYTGASRLNAAVVESATDLTAVSRLPDLIVGDSEPVTVKFLSASGAYESWSGGGTYTLSISIGALGGDGIAAYFQTSSFTTVTNGWTGRLNLASGSLPSVVAGYLAERPGAQSVPLFVQVRVTDADGNTETYARQAVSVSGAVSVSTTANSTPVTYATAADVAADASTASAAAIAAAASASAAAGSASTAAGHVTTAGNSATAAAASAVTAGNSATTASGHATTATTQATNAATSSSNASTYRDAAAVSASSATSSAGTATTQAALATTNGAAQVALATTQATNAGASASAAAISAAAALVSEAAALVSKNAAAASAATASAVSGSGNGTFSAAALTGVNSITASASTPLTLTGGSTGASLVLGQGATAGSATTTITGSGTAVTRGPVRAIDATTLGIASISSTDAQAAGRGGSLTLGGFRNDAASEYRNFAALLGGKENSTTGNAAGYLGFYTNNNGALPEIARLTSTGNLLIGTTTDAASLAGGLVVNGSGTAAAASNTTTGALRVTGGVGVSGAGYFGGLIGLSGAGSDATTGINWGTSTTLYQTQAGRLALNHVGGTLPVLSLLENGTPRGNIYTASGTMTVGTVGAFPLNIQTNNATALRIGATGVVDVPLPLLASSSIAGAFTVGNGSAATNVAIGGGSIIAGANVQAVGNVNVGPVGSDFAAGRINILTGSDTVPGLSFGGSAYGFGILEKTDGNLHFSRRSGSATNTTWLSVGRDTGAATFAGAVTIAGTVIHTLSATPASASATGTVGTMSWDANYIYICTATNTWKRVAIATW